MRGWTKSDIFKYLVATLFLGSFAILFLPFFSELILAAIVAFAMEPFLGRFLQVRHFQWKASVAAILFGMSALLALPVTYVFYKTYKYVLKISEGGIQNSEPVQQLMLIKSKVLGVVDSLAARFDLETQFDISGWLDEGLNHAVNFFAQQSTQLAARIPGVLISTFVFIAGLYYFLAEARTLKTVFMKQRLLTSPEAGRLIGVIQKSCSNTVITSVAIALVQGTIVALGSLIFKAGDWAVVWIITAICSFIPVIGAGPVAFVLALAKFVMGDYGQAIGLVVTAVIAGAMDNLLRPILMSSSDQDLNPVVGLLAIVGALLIFGMPGLLLGPVIASVALKIIPTLFESPTAAAKDP
ncbi:MAG: AI-2E family transporter [Bdellovibrionales bacterium]